MGRLTESRGRSGSPLVGRPGGYRQAALSVRAAGYRPYAACCRGGESWCEEMTWDG
ncbi:hypothetical protein GCM10009759_10070 [Kitasatospora saccharophila]|uniref:Uncharacterized protein n=1 Tax=Kitasatospora saccharophila TaxID=407973 RepID=A0ABN1F523_9ACTN